MRKSFGLAVVAGFALNIVVASHFTSYAKVNQPSPDRSSLAKEQLLTNPNPANLGLGDSDSSLPLSQGTGKDNIFLVDTPPQVISTDVPAERLYLLGKENPPSQILATLHPPTAIANPTSMEQPSPSLLLEPSVLSPHSQNLSIAQLYAQTPNQEIPQTKDGETFRQMMQEAMTQNYHQRPMGELVQAIAQKFLGTAYKAGLLDQSKEETLVVTLKQFDCVLFIETVLAIARSVAVQDYSYPTFVNHIRDQRYRNGQMDGYCSRLHYFSEWIYDNEKRGTVQNLGQALGGVPLNKTLNFMSKHRQSYPRLSDEATYQCIVEGEAQFEGVTVNYIPTKQIRRVYSQLQPGDIIAVATNIPGLDVTHTGLVYRQPNGNIGFIHASPAGQVTIASDLQRYISKVDHAIGILVARPVDPRQTQNTEFQRGYGLAPSSQANH